MGVENMKFVLISLAPMKLSGRATKVLLRMAMTALDPGDAQGRAERVYFGGWEQLGLALGYQVRQVNENGYQHLELTKAQETQVGKVIKELVDRGCITPLLSKTDRNRKTRNGRRPTQEYLLHLTADDCPQGALFRVGPPLQKGGVTPTQNGVVTPTQEGVVTPTQEGVVTPPQSGGAQEVRRTDEKTDRPPARASRPSRHAPDAVRTNPSRTSSRQLPGQAQTAPAGLGIGIEEVAGEDGQANSGRAGDDAAQPIDWAAELEALDPRLWGLLLHRRAERNPGFAVALVGEQIGDGRWLADANEDELLQALRSAVDPPPQSDPKTLPPNRRNDDDERKAG